MGVYIMKNDGMTTIRTYDPTLANCNKCGSRAVNVQSTTFYGTISHSIECENPQCGNSFSSGLNYTDMVTKWNAQNSYSPTSQASPYSMNINAALEFPTV